MPDFDVLVIGAGIGGYTAAIRAAQLGLRAAIVEKDAIGGLCLNCCIPSKALLHAADVANAVRTSHELGITHGDLRLDLGVAVDRSREVVAKLVDGVETLLVHNKVTVIRGEARLAGDGSIVVQPDNRRVTAANVIIATGAASRSLPSLPVDGKRVITSRQALELRQAPESIVIVGGGPIGVEFAYLFRSYGAKVTLLEMLPRLLPNEDQDVSRQLERSFRAQGIEVRTGIAVSGAEVTDSEVIVISLTAAKRCRRRVLIGVGFGPAGLGLEGAGVGWARLDQIDGRCRTNVPGYGPSAT
jgi:dihydrolipoamide dehydrogenase